MVNINITGEYITQGGYFTQMTMPQSVAKGTVFVVTVTSDGAWQSRIEDDGAGWITMNPASSTASKTEVQITVVGSPTSQNNYIVFQDMNYTGIKELNITPPSNIIDVNWGAIIARDANDGMMTVMWQPVTIEGSTSGITYGIESGSHVFFSGFSGLSAMIRPQVFDQLITYNLVATKGSIIAKKSFTVMVYGVITKPSNVIIKNVNDGVQITWNPSTVTYGTGRIKQYDIIYYPSDTANYYILNDVNSGIIIQDNIQNGNWIFKVKAIYSFGDGAVYAIEEQEFLVSFGSTIKYMVNGEWKDCEIYYVVNGEWTPCDIKYCDGVNWLDL